MIQRSNAARLPRDDDSRPATRAGASEAHPPAPCARLGSLKTLVVVPTLEAGAADFGALELVRILADAGHRPIAVSRGGRLELEVVAGGGEFVRLDVASTNPAVMAANVPRLVRLVRERNCTVIHAHGRASAWTAYLAARITQVPFLTTWHKGFRDQNRLKHLYNSVMVRGDRVIAVSDQIAELIAERYGESPRIAVVPASVDTERFDPAAVSRERIEAVRRAWGIKEDTKVILVAGRMLRRKGHHLVVRAVHRLKELKLKDFVCVFAADNLGRSRYGSELWDLVLATGTADVIRLGGAIPDRPAAYAAATVVVSAAVQAEGLQRAMLEAQAMARPVIVSDLGAGPEVVLAPPAVPEDRMTGLRFQIGDEGALAAALIRLFSMPEPIRQRIGERGRDWMLAHFNARIVADQVLRLYEEVVSARRAR